MSHLCEKIIRNNLGLPITFNVTLSRILVAQMMKCPLACLNNVRSQDWGRIAMNAASIINRIQRRASRISTTFLTNETTSCRTRYNEHVISIYSPHVHIENPIQPEINVQRGAPDSPTQFSYLCELRSIVQPNERTDRISISLDNDNYCRHRDRLLTLNLK